MRVAFLLNEFPAIPETFFLRQIVGLLERGHDVHIYAAPPDSTEKVHADVEKYDLLARTRYWPAGGKGLRGVVRAVKVTSRLLVTDPALLVDSLNPVTNGPVWRSGLPVFASAGLRGRHEEYDVIQCHYGALGLVGRHLTRVGLLEGPLITAFHGGDITVGPRKWGEHVYDPLFRHPGLFTANSEYTRGLLLRLGADPERVHVLPMGLRLSEYPFSEKRLDPGATPRILSVARLVPKKGLEYAVRAVGLLRDRGVPVRYDIVGEGPLRRPLSRLIGQLGLEGRVTLQGWKSREEVIHSLASSHVLVQPSVTGTDGDQEGQGVVLLEGQAMGLPVIATRHNGFPESLDDGKSGFLVPERDPAAIAERLAALLRDPEGWPEIGRAGRRLVEQRFDIDKLVDRQVELYHELIARSRQRV